MNFIHEERENIMKNNNTAQEHFINHLEKGDKSSTEITIHEALHGNIDFSVLDSQGYKNIRKIELKPGEVTSISNLPKGLEKLIVSNQLMTELENLPKTLRELDCQKNHIRSIDISSLEKLRVLRISENQIKELENLPDSLEEIYCDNNHISVINLRDLLNLRVLHISNNKAVIIENLPPSIVDFKSDNNPYLEIQYANLHSSNQPDDDEETGQEKINYIESLFDYLKLKRKYEEQYYKDKKRAFENAPTRSLGKKRAARVIPKCIQCKQPGGTLFSKKEQTYYAVCGNRTSPCHLDIEIFNGKSFSIDELLETFGEEELTRIKTIIICQKMDNLFHYENEEVALKKFKENMEEFALMNDEYNELLEKNNQLYKDDIRSEMASRKTQQIYDLMGSIKELIQQYEKDGNHQLLKAAVELQVQELNPEIHNLRILRYEIMEMDMKKGKKVGGNFGKEEEEDSEETVVFKESALFQRYASLQKMQVFMGKPSNVVKYRLSAK